MLGGSGGWPCWAGHGVSWDERVGRFATRRGGPSYASMAEKSVQWPRFRGPGGSGVSRFDDIPTQWKGERARIFCGRRRCRCRGTTPP